MSHYSELDASSYPADQSPESFAGQGDAEATPESFLTITARYLTLLDKHDVDTLDGQSITCLLNLSKLRQSGQTLGSPIEDANFEAEQLFDSASRVPRDWSMYPYAVKHIAAVFAYFHFFLQPQTLSPVTDISNFLERLQLNYDLLIAYAQFKSIVQVSDSDKELLPGEDYSPVEARNIIGIPKIRIREKYIDPPNAPYVPALAITSQDFQNTHVVPEKTSVPDTTESIQKVKITHKHRPEITKTRQTKINAAADHWKRPRHNIDINFSKLGIQPLSITDLKACDSPEECVHIMAEHIIKLGKYYETPNLKNFREFRAVFGIYASKLELLIKRKKWNLPLSYFRQQAELEAALSGAMYANRSLAIQYMAEIMRQSGDVNFRPGELHDQQFKFLFGISKTALNNIINRDKWEITPEQLLAEAERVALNTSVPNVIRSLLSFEDVLLHLTEQIRLAGNSYTRPSLSRAGKADFYRTFAVKYTALYRRMIKEDWPVNSILQLIELAEARNHIAVR